MNRREFLGSGIAAGATLSTTRAFPSSRIQTEPFKFDLAPHFGSFSQHAGLNLKSQIDFIADCGFRTVEDRGFRDRDPDSQITIARALGRRGMNLGYILGIGSYDRITFASPQRVDRERILKELTQAAEMAKRSRARSIGVICGKMDCNQSRAKQMSTAAETLRTCAEIAEKAGVILLLESSYNLSGMLVQSISQAALLCRMIGSPTCRCVYDTYSDAAAGGNVCAGLQRHWTHIGHLQVGDFPGGKEPGTGGVDFANLFGLLQQRRFQGAIGMDHGIAQPGVAGEVAVLEAYRCLTGERSASASCEPLALAQLHLL